ncbi:carbon monoxide dehydrogenase subunit G [Mycolicibacterium arabiense]|uniref:Carbon monoxide dehydrogenase subunit G n=1 Tax=Mycolicibacterium arabiense TaxID=1286181 RepID=A0A7I7RVL3_9MYCO|nr:SRPBCC family protein [Mycolicibacterium arabiense]MCV7373582.1 SRPBCC family protein [Mycolicibacterium arabiense]BBY48211.1 carbon monoxide dehydrogenase subunit G [Mycolicibacterium arabiense]
MQLVNEFRVDAPLDVAWSVLTDIPKVIDCVPGAGLDRRDGDDYHAHVAIKVGPVGMTMSGKASVVSRDDAGREMVVRGSARDRRGNGGGEATVRLLARDDGGRTVVTVTTDLELSGRIAQFGTGVITQVSNRIIRQFADRLDAAIAGDGPAGQAPEPVGAVTRSPRPIGPASDRVVLALTALAGAVLGLAIGRLADRVSHPPRRG